MTASRRVASAASILALLAFNVACPGPSEPVPEARLCEGAPASADVDELRVSAFHEVGGQGFTMVAVQLEWTGGGAPECANAEITLYETSGLLVESTTASLETVEADAGRRASTPFYFIRNVCGYVEVESYGHSVTAPIAGCDSDEDAGVDAGVDAGFDANVEGDAG